MTTVFNEFRIYYEDGTHDDDHLTVPSHGVLVILQRRASDGRWSMTSNAPYYGYDGKEWLPMYENDLVDYLINRKPILSLIVGRIVNKGLFTQVYEQAKADRSNMD